MVGRVLAGTITFIALIGIGATLESLVAKDGTVYKAGASPVRSSPLRLYSKGKIRLYIDEETGCRYLITYDGFIINQKAKDGLSHKGCGDTVE